MVSSAGSSTHSDSSENVKNDSESSSHVNYGEFR